MFRGFGAFLHVEIWRRIPIAAGELVEQPVNVAVDLRRRAINFNAIAGGEQYDFVEPGTEFDAATVAGKQRGMHRQFLATFHWRGLVAYTCDEQFHALAFSVLPIRQPLAPDSAQP